MPSWAQPSSAVDLFVRPDLGKLHRLPPGREGRFGLETRADLGPRLEGQRMREIGRKGVREILVRSDAGQS